MVDRVTVVTLEWIALFEASVFPKLVWPDAVSQYRHDINQHAAVQAEMEVYRPEMLSYMKAKNAL